MLVFMVNVTAGISRLLNEIKPLIMKVMLFLCFILTLKDTTSYASREWKQTFEVINSTSSSFPVPSRFTGVPPAVCILHAAGVSAAQHPAVRTASQTMVRLICECCIANGVGFTSVDKIPSKDFGKETLIVSLFAN